MRAALAIVLVVLAAACGDTEADAPIPPPRPGPRTAVAVAPDAPDAAVAPAPAPNAPAPVAEAAPDGGPAAEPPPSGPARPTLFAESIEVDGPLPEAVVVRVLRRHRPEVQFCYEQALQHDPALAGRVVMAFVIGPTGSVTEASIASSALGRTVDECLVRAVRRWQFPSVESGQSVRVTHPVTFSIADVAPDAPPGTIRWTLSVEPARVSMARLGQVSFGITAHNGGERTVDPGRHPLELTIDGEPSMALGMGFGNGGMQHEWVALPPGQTVRDSRVGFTDLVDAPGRYVIALEKSGAEVARAVLVVTP